MLKYSYDFNGNMASQTLGNVSPPLITGQPVRQVLEPGEVATFSVVVSDASGMTFRWKFNGTDIPGATSDSLLLTNVGTASEGQYSVMVTNSAGSVTSAPAALLLDSDRDGLPDSWEIANFGNTTSQRSAGDPDGDGVTNSDEFYDGTNPNSSTSLRPRLVAYSDTGGSVTIAPMKLSYDLGETVTLTAIAVAPDVFIGWAGDLNTGDLVSTTNPANFTINGNKTVRARFASAVPLAPGLVAWWRAENNAQDVTGVNNGMLGAGISFNVGKVGEAFGFNGGAIKVPASKSLDVGAGNGLTIEAWIRPADLAHQYPLVEWNDGSKFGTHFWISSAPPGQLSPGCLVANIVDINHTPHIIVSQPGLLSTSGWQHVAVTYDRASGISMLFINATTVAFANLGSFAPLTATDLYLGHRPGDAFYSGLMDEPTIYNRALTLNEIFEIYSADFVGKDLTHPYFKSPSQLPNVVLGATYTQQLTTILGKLPISFSLSVGLLPPGMTVSSDGLVSGVSSTPGGVFDFTVRVTDAAGLFTEQTCTLQVIESVPAPAGLVGWWPGDGNAKDIAAGHDGTLLGGVLFTPAKVGDGFTFNNNADQVTIPHDPSLDINSGGFTTEFWMKGGKNQPDSLCAQVEKSHGFIDNTGWAFQVFNTSGVVTFNIGAGGPGSTNFPGVLSAVDVLDNTFHHVAGSWDGSSIRLYIDGILQGTASLSTPSNNNRALNLGFAAGGGSPQRFFRGQVDELSIYNRALSGVEIASIYNAGPAGKR